MTNSQHLFPNERIIELLLFTDEYFGLIVETVSQKYNKKFTRKPLQSQKHFLEVGKLPSSVSIILAEIALK